MRRHRWGPFLGCSKPTLALLSIFLIALTLAMSVLVKPHQAVAVTNEAVNFQARLMNASGAIVPDGYYNVEFKLYDVSSGGSALWTDTYYDSNGVTAGNDNRIRVENGYLTVSLGSQAGNGFPTTINWDQQLWITMNIGGTTQTATPTWDGEMNPRLRLTAVPYAFRAGQLASLAGGNTGVLQFAASFGQDSVITLPDPGASTATVCYQNSSSCGFVTGTAGSYIQNGTSVQSPGNFAIRSTAAGSVGGLIQGANGQTADLFDLQTWNGTTATTVFAVNNVGALTLNGTGTTLFTTTKGVPDQVNTKINVPAYNPGASGQVLALGLPSGSHATSRAISVFDARTSAHQPSIGVLSPDENNIFGFSWDGDNTTAYLKTTGSDIGIQTATGDVATFNNTQITLLQDTLIATGKNLTFNSGSGIFDQSASAGIFKTGTGDVTLMGNTLVDGTKTFTVNSGLSTLGGGLTTTTGVFSGANAITLGTTGTSTGAVLFKGSTAASGTLTLQGPANPSTNNYTLSIPAITNNANVCTDNAICSGYQAAPSTGSYLFQVPASTAANTVTPTANSVVGLTVNGTSGTAATAVIIDQAQGADALNVNVTGGSQTNGIAVTRTNAGTLTNGLAVTNTSGTITNGLSFSGTIGTDINRSSGILSLQGTGGVTITAGGTTTLAADTAGAGTVNLGNTNATTINIGGASGASTTIGGGNVAHTIAIGAGGTSTIQAVSLGSTGSTSTTTIQGGTNASAVSIQAGSGGTISIGNTNSNPITLGGTSGTTTLNGTIKLAAALGAGGANSAALCRDSSTTNITACDATNTSGRPFLQGGNAFGTTGSLGTTDAQNLQIITGASSTVRATFDQSNNLYLGNGITAASPSAFNVQATGSSTATVAGAAISLVGGTGNTTGAGGQAKIQGGDSGNGAAATGGAVLIQGGTANGTGASNGGKVTLQGGTLAGSGVKGLIELNGGTYFTTGTYSSGSTSTITQSVVDSNSAILTSATAGSLTFTVPSPTNGASQAGRLLYIINSGSNAFTLSFGSSNLSLSPNATATLVWTGSAWTGAGADSATLQNDYTNSIGGTTPEILVDSTRNGVDIQDNSLTSGTRLLAVRGTATASTLGSPLFVVDNTGKVGIGIEQPARTLDVAVNSSSIATPAIRLAQAGSGDATIELRTAGSANSFYLGQDASNSGAFSINSSTVASSFATIAHVQSTGIAQDPTATTIARAFSSNVTAGSLIVASIAWDTTNTTSVTCSDTQGNLFTTLTVYNDTTTKQALTVCYAPNAVGGADTVTATFGATSISRRIIISEYTGVATGSPVDVTTGQGGIVGTTGADAITSGTVNTSQGSVLVYGAVEDTSGSTTVTAGTGFTQRSTLNGVEMAVQDRILGSAGTTASTNTFGAAHRYDAIVVVFRPAETTLTDTFASPLFTLTQSGAAKFKNSANSSTAFQVQNAGGTMLFGVDTVTPAINVGVVGSTAQVSTVNVGTSTGATQTVNIGSATTGSAANGTTVLIQGGNTASAVSIQSLASGTIGIGSNNAANTIQIGSTSLNSSTQTINIGNNNTSGGTTTIVIGTGSTATGGTTTVQAKASVTVATNGVTRATFDNTNTVYLGNGVTAAAPNDFVVQGTGSATGGTAGGKLTVIGGTGNTTGAGGAVVVQGGTAGGAGAGGAVTVQGGTAAATAGSAGGALTLASGNGTTTGTGGIGGNIVINAGNAGGSGNNAGGNITALLGAATGTGAQGTFQVQNALGASLLMVDPSNTAASLNLAVNSGAETASGFTTTYPAAGFGTVTVSQTTTTGNFASGTAAVQAVATSTNSGIRANLGAALTTSTGYVISFSAKTTGSTWSNDIDVRYNRTGTTSDGATAVCSTSNSGSSSFSSRTVTTTGWTKITCFITTSASAGDSTANLVIFQTASATRTFYVDNISIVAQNSSGTQNVGDLKVGGATSQGLTLLTLDTYAATPFTGTNASLAGSMYFDTTQGKIQCYDGSAWGACGAAPNNIITLAPEYAGAVLHSSGSSSIGTMTSDFCSGTSGININDGTSSQPSICSSTQTFNFYRWTSPQGTAQQYSIWVTYQLPSTFKNFVNGTTTLTGRTDSTNSTVQYTIYKNVSGNALTTCSASVTVSTGVQSNWQVVAPTTDPSTCTFAAGNSIIFKIDVISSSNANAYVSNLNFAFSNQ